MQDSFPHRFSPIAIGSYTLKNRITNTAHAAHFQTGDGLRPAQSGQPGSNRLLREHRAEPRAEARGPARSRARLFPHFRGTFFVTWRRLFTVEHEPQALHEAANVSPRSRRRMSTGAGTRLGSPSSSDPS